MNTERVSLIHTFVTTLRVFSNAVDDANQNLARIAEAVEKFRAEANQVMDRYTSKSHTDAMKAATDGFGDDSDDSAADKNTAPSQNEDTLMNGAWELARAGKEKALAIKTNEDTRRAVKCIAIAIELGEMARSSAATGK